jgi:hypothetical protein
MALYPTGDFIIKSEVATAGFVPDLWADEIIASYKRSLVAANNFKRMNFKGKKGDSVTFPAPVRGSATAKTSETAVNIIQESGTGITIGINSHFEYSRLIEDFAETQALSSLRRFYTEDAGYALALRIDSDLLALTANAQTGNGTLAFNAAVVGGNGSTLYTSGSPNATAITDAGIRRVIQTLDDFDVPMENRTLTVPPVVRRDMMGIARFTEQAFRGDGSTLKNGLIGDVYGVSVFVTTNCPTATGAARICVMMHPEYGVLIEQLGIRTQTQYKQEYLATLLTADTIYGVGELRDRSAVCIAVPAS